MDFLLSAFALQEDKVNLIVNFNIILHCLAWSSGIPSTRGVMGHGIESRQRIGLWVLKERK
jgi:hypothetical protein